MREYRETHERDPEYLKEKSEFQRKLLFRREQIYREYDLEKLMKDAQQITIKNLMDFPDTDMEMVKSRINGWVNDQQKIRRWKDKAFGNLISYDIKRNNTSLR